MSRFIDKPLAEFTPWQLAAGALATSCAFSVLAFAALVVDALTWRVLMWLLGRAAGWLS